jgi:peptidyl-prolyl cis-trans isomerase D
MNTKYNNLVSKGLYTTSKQAEFESILNKSTVDFSFVVKNYGAVPDSLIKISESDLESYYSTHKDIFKRTALRDIEYVTFDVVPSEEDIKETERWINTIKEEFITAKDPVQYINLNADNRYTGFFTSLRNLPANLQEFVKKEDKTSVFGPYQEEGSYKIAKLIESADRPDSVHVRHILLAPGEAKTIEKTREAADSLVKLIKSGSSFDKLAMENSLDEGTAQIGGDLGWFSEGRMILAFNNACFNGKKGEITTVETKYGIHIIEILAQSKSSRKYDIGYIDRKIMASSTTNQRVYSLASQFAGTNNTYEKFNSSIAAENLNKRIANDVMPQQKTLPGLDNPRSLIISLFSANKGEIILDNNQQAVFEVGDKYVIAYCTKVQEDGIAPMKDVVNDLRFALIREKKADVLSSEFIKNNVAGGSLEDIGRKMNLNVQEATQVNFRSYSIPGAGSEPALIAAASSGKEGIVSGPVTGNNGVYMFYVNSLTEAPAQDLKLLQERMSSTFQMRGSYEAYEALRKGANIIDKRYKFY